MNGQNNLIDQIVGEISQKNLLNELCQIALTSDALQELKEEYSEEFKSELFEVKRGVSIKDLEDYFGVPIVVSKLNSDEKYQLLKKV